VRVFVKCAEKKKKKREGGGSLDQGAKQGGKGKPSPALSLTALQRGDIRFTKEEKGGGGAGPGFLPILRSRGGGGKGPVQVEGEGEGGKGKREKKKKKKKRKGRPVLSYQTRSRLGHPKGGKGKRREEEGSPYHSDKGKGGKRGDRQSLKVRKERKRKTLS